MIDILLATSVVMAQQNPYTPDEEPPIAYFDVVPQQYVTGVFDMGVVAYHLEEIDRVEYTVVREGFIGDWSRRTRIRRVALRVGPVRPPPTRNVHGYGTNHELSHWRTRVLVLT